MEEKRHEGLDGGSGGEWSGGGGRESSSRRAPLGSQPWVIGRGAVGVSTRGGGGGVIDGKESVIAGGEGGFPRRNSTDGAFGTSERIASSLLM